MLNTNELTELILKAVQAAAAEGGSKAPVVEDGEVPDLSKVDLRKELAVPEPANAEEYLEMKSRTPARLRFSPTCPRSFWSATGCSLCRPAAAPRMSS